MLKPSPKLPRVHEIKKIGHKRSIYLQRRAFRAARALNRARIAVRRIAKRRAKRHASSHRITASHVFRWRAPRELNLFIEPHRQNLLVGLKELRAQVKRGRAVLIDFGATEKVFSDGMLLLVSEIRRLLRYSRGGASMSCTVPLHDKVAQVLKQVGLFDMLGVTCSVHPRDSDVVAWRHAYGAGAEGSRFDDVLADYDGEITPALSSALYRGVSEAMTNVVNHAYSAPRQDGLEVDMKNDWWMFSAEQNGMLSVVFCDLGAGISGTLPAKRPQVWKRILLRSRRGDGSVIRYAVADSVSRTRQGHRGKGLGQIVKLIEGVPGAKVAVLSNRGAYSRDAHGEVKVAEFSGSILGTLINWQIPLPSREAS